MMRKAKAPASFSEPGWCRVLRRACPGTARRAQTSAWCPATAPRHATSRMGGRSRIQHFGQFVVFLSVCFFVLYFELHKKRKEISAPAYIQPSYVFFNFLSECHHGAQLAGWVAVAESNVSVSLLSFCQCVFVCFNLNFTRSKNNFLLQSTFNHLMFFL